MWYGKPLAALGLQACMRMAVTHTHTQTTTAASAAATPVAAAAMAAAAAPVVCEFHVAGRSPDVTEHPWVDWALSV